MATDKSKVPKTHRVQMRDIAEHAGVAVSSVSRVLNQSGSVSAELEQRVLQAARDLGYPLLRREAQLRLRSILICAYWRHGELVEFYASMIGGAEKAGGDLNCEVDFTTVQPDAEGIDQLLNRLKRDSIDGVILLAIDHRTLVQAVSETGLPLVLLNSYDPLLAVDAFLPNGYMGAMQATEHLLVRGHQRILNITSTRHRLTMRHRHAGFRDMLQQYDVPFDPALLVEVNHNGRDVAYEAMQHFLQQRPVDFTAVLASSDENAFGTMRALQEAGHRIPEDVSIIGFDDVSMAAYVAPALTTVRIETAEIGGMAVNRLLERTQNPDLTPIYVEIGTRLVVRDSVRDLSHTEET